MFANVGYQLLSSRKQAQTRKVVGVAIGCTCMKRREKEKRKENEEEERRERGERSWKCCLMINGLCCYCSLLYCTCWY